MTLRVVKPRSHVEKPLVEPGTVSELGLVVSQLRRRQEEFGLQPNLELAKQCQRIITQEQCLLI